tara:strand:- start:333 stop:596 length:264 start_codon:yes stop_codon:yes gene_type:complete
MLTQRAANPVITLLELSERIRRIKQNPIDGGILEVVEEIESVKVVIRVAFGVEVVGHSGDFGIPSERVYDNLTAFYLLLDETGYRLD